MASIIDEGALVLEHSQHWSIHFLLDSHDPNNWLWLVRTLDGHNVFLHERMRGSQAYHSLALANRKFNSQKGRRENGSPRVEIGPESRAPGERAFRY